MSEHQELQKKLEARFANLEKRVAGLEGDLRSSHSQYWEERASEVSGDEVLEGLESAALEEIEQIRAALKRIKEGDYGARNGCGKKTGARRLAALPLAVLRIDCASEGST